MGLCKFKKAGCDRFYSNGETIRGCVLCYKCKSRETFRGESMTNALYVPAELETGCKFRRKDELCSCYFVNAPGGKRILSFEMKGEDRLIW